MELYIEKIKQGFFQEERTVIYEKTLNYWDMLDNNKVGTLYKTTKGEIYFKKSWQTEVLTKEHLEGIVKIMQEY